MTKRYEIDEELESGLRYTEDTSRSTVSNTIRDCCLWQPGVDQPVSGLNVEVFRQRFGAVAVPAEGIGGVETLPAYRRRGLVSILWKKVIAEMAKRVPVVFVSDSIEGMYEKFGCITCLADGYLSIPVRNVERLASLRGSVDRQHIRAGTLDDLPAIVALYNTAHANRPWTHERRSTWNQLHITETWSAGSEVLVVERDGSMAGYAILREIQFGHGVSPYAVDELTAIDTEAADTLLVEIAARCWELRLSEFWVREPPDSMVGIAARRLGSTYHMTFPPSGGMMGMILQRQQLLQMLEPELRCRLSSDAFQPDHEIAFDALNNGELLPDDRDLLRLLVGYWSATDARALGVEIARHHQRVCDAWFPGGGTPFVPLPYAHTLDRY